MITIRNASKEDAADILKIYEPYIMNTAITFEYDVPSVKEMENRICETLKKYPYYVAVMNNKIVGYAYAGPLKPRAAYHRSVELSIYVEQKSKERGIGKMLYEKLEYILKENGITNLYACIASPRIEDSYLTRDSEIFHEKMGYQKIGHFHQCGYKFGRWYDMIWMEKIINVHS